MQAKLNWIGLEHSAQKKPVFSKSHNRCSFLREHMTNCSGPRFNVYLAQLLADFRRVML